MASHTLGNCGSWDALQQAVLALQTNNWTPSSGHNNTPGSSCFQKETSHQSKSTSPVREIQLAAVVKGGWKDQIKQQQQQYTQSQALCYPPFAGRSLCGWDPVGPKVLFSLGWFGNVFYYHVKQERMVGAVLSEASGASSLLCDFWQVLGLNLRGTESACLRWEGETQRFSPLVYFIPARPSVECFVKLKDFNVQERDKCLKGKYLKYFLKVTKFHTWASQEFLGDVWGLDNYS